MDTTVLTNAAVIVVLKVNVTGLQAIVKEVVNQDGQDKCVIKSALRAILVQTAEINAVITVTKGTLATKLLDDVMEDVKQDGRDFFAMKLVMKHIMALTAHRPADQTVLT